MASSGTARTARYDPTTAHAVKTNTRARWVAQASMIRPTTAASVPVPGRGLGPHPGDRRLEAAFGIDQERRARDHRIPGGDAGEHLDPLAIPDARPHLPGLEMATRPGEEHILV